MSNKSLKDMVDYIQKYAVAPPPPDGSAPVTPPRGPVPSKAPAAGGLPGNPVIAKMQEALVGLARDVTSQLNLKNLTSGNPRQQQEAGGRDSFGDFLTRHFMRNSNVPAVEFNPDPTKSDLKDKDPRTASKLSWVMDTMARIGGHANEFAIDGKWGPRTSAALDNVAAFVNGLFSMADAFGARATAYNQDYFKNFQNAVSNQEGLSPTDKIDAAEKLTKHINAIRKMYTQLKGAVLQSPQYQTYIERDTPYLQHEKPQTGFTPNADQLAALRQVYPKGFNIYTGNDEQGNRVAKNISVDDLVNPQALGEWMKNQGVNQDPAEVLKQVTNQVGSA